MLLGSAAVLPRKETMEIPYGYCHCGCGEKTSLVAVTNRSQNRYCGTPNKFIHGHNEAPNRVPDNKLYLVEDRGYKTPCWIWQLAVDKNGYGKISRQGGSHEAHRRIYEGLRGPIPADHHLDHLCRIPPCVNPDHVEPVLQVINTQRGAMAKMTPEKVRTARKMRAEGHTGIAIAALFGVSPSVIYAIGQGRAWVNVV